MNPVELTSSLLFWQLSLLWPPVFRYGYHVSQTSYVICKDPPTIKKIFGRIRNFDGEGSYPETCGGVRILHVRDVTTGYDSSQADLRSVRHDQKTLWGVSTDLSLHNVTLCVLWRSSQCPGAVRWSPSRCRTAWWPRWEPAALNQRSSITPSSVLRQEKGELTPKHYLLFSSPPVCCETEGQSVGSIQISLWKHET